MVLPMTLSPATLPTHAYTPWLRRVGAALIDIVPVAVLFVIGVVVLGATRSCLEYPVAGLGTADAPYLQQTCGASAVGQWTAVVLPVVAIAYLLWNYGYRQGTTGSSVGKSLLKFKVVSEATGQPIGFGMSTARELLHVFVDGLLCNIGYLFPLVDAKRQTFADKIVKTVCRPR
jgi:uncharacterized RDD family membrane protein YckC